MFSFEDEVEVVCIVNSIDFGLVGVVWINNVSLVYCMVVKVCVGIFWVNGYKVIYVLILFGGLCSFGFG